MLCLPEGKAKADKFLLDFGMDLTLWLLWILSMHILMRRLFYWFVYGWSSLSEKRIGSHIVTEALAYFAKNFRKARLAYVKGNPQSQHFWEKQGFKSIGCEVKQELYTVVIAEQSLED